MSNRCCSTQQLFLKLLNLPTVEVSRYQKSRLILDKFTFEIRHALTVDADTSACWECVWLPAQLLHGGLPQKSERFLSEVTDQSDRYLYTMCGGCLRVFLKGLQWDLNPQPACFNALLCTFKHTGHKPFPSAY